MDIPGNVPAIIFLVGDWVEMNSSVSGDLIGDHAYSYLSWAEIKEMSKNGIAFGSHTLTHPSWQT